MMIADVDASLAAMLKAEALAGGETEIAFDPPTLEWAAGRSAPVVDLFLYDMYEDSRYRGVAAPEPADRAAAGNGGSVAVRHFRLSYLVTAWTKRVEDEHRLLGQVLEAMLGSDHIPAEHLRGRLREEGATVGLGMPNPAGRSRVELWAAIGGQLRLSIEVVALVPVRYSRQHQPARPDGRSGPPREPTGQG
jgi:hypothetical protein